MTIDFFRANEQNAPTTEYYIFTADYGIMMTGQWIEQNGRYYQVTGQLLPDDQSAALAVFLCPIDRKPTSFNY